MNKNQKKLFKAKKNKQMQQFRDYPGLGLGIVWIIFVVDIDNVDKYIQFGDVIPVLIIHKYI
jgi:hypothetical protein